MQFEEFKNYFILFLKENLSGKLIYHNLQHTLDVLHYTELLAANERCNETEITLIKTAAILHDSGFVTQYLHNEKHAIEIAINKLPKFNYSTANIETISSIIAATDVKTLPNTLLQKILKDADYYNFGSEQYVISARNLKEELDIHNINYSEQEWIKIQINFLEKHKYFTKTATDLWQKNKLKNLFRLKSDY